MNGKRKELPRGREVPLLEAVTRERIQFDFRRTRRLRRWYALYLGTTLLVALLAIAVLVLAKIEIPPSSEGVIDGWGEALEGILLPDVSVSAPPAQVPQKPSKPTEPSLTPELLYQYDYSAVPEGEIPIIPMDLSLTEYGAAYFHNTTGLAPDGQALLSQSLNKQEKPVPLANTTGPLVLILHTHGTESYSPEGAISYRDGEETRTADREKNVVAVGKVLADSLNRAGIETVHCSVLHDELQYKDSYARAEATIREYLERYPTIRLVIDLHRDSILKSTGEMVRPVSLIDGEAAAQVMCVVGSSWGGDENPNWEGNLALALQLRQRLNEEYDNLCRPPYLKSSTYNQELAPYSLLLEVGASGNSLQEAKRSAEAIARALVTMIPEM